MYIIHGVCITDDASLDQRKVSRVVSRVSDVKASRIDRYWNDEPQV